MRKFPSAVRLIPPILWMSLIWLLSAMPGQGSGNSSRWLIEFFQSIGIDLFALFGEHTSFVIRKGAHFTEYFVLFLLWHTALKGCLEGNRRAWLAWGIAVVYAMSDELHQSFVPNRTAAVFDVGIDACGAALAAALVWFLNKRRRKKAQLAANSNK